MFEGLLVVQIIVFVMGALALTLVSWQALRHPRSHGFTRYFAWLAIVALVALNLPAWFRTPLAWRQVISWLLLLASLYAVIAGLLRLRGAGEPDVGRADDQALMGLEKTTKLVTDGIYRYIRHPLYASLLYLAWGAFFKLPSLLGGGLVLLATLCLWLTARRGGGRWTLSLL